LANRGAIAEKVFSISGESTSASSKQASKQSNKDVGPIATLSGKQLPVIKHTSGSRSTPQLSAKPVEQKTVPSEISPSAQQGAAYNDEPIEEPLLPDPIPSHFKQPAEKEVKDAKRSSAVFKSVNKPGKLDLAVAKEASRKDMELSADTKATETLGKVADRIKLKAVEPMTPAVTTSPAAASPAPDSSASASPAPSMPRQARVIRVLPATRVDIPAKPMVVAGTESPSTPVSAAPRRGLSRQPSLTSINQPSTPNHELISEAASYTSASASRAASPSRDDGTGPASRKTKSQLKKDRRAKRTEDSKLSESASIDIPEPELIQAPLLGRKKKAKK